MSIEAVNQFLTKVSQDQKLQAEVSQAMEANGSQATTEVAAKHGYKFSQQELDSRIGQFKAIQDKQSADSELNEEELETVAGGLCTPDFWDKLEPFQRYGLTSPGGLTDIKDELFG